MTTFYLAARYGRREELCGYKADLETRGHTVPARWLLGEHQVHGLEAAWAVEADGPVPADQAVLFAEDDIEDLLASDVVVNFTEPPRTTSSRGGRHVEYGIALGLRRTGAGTHQLFLVGQLENVFHALPEVDGRFDDWEGFLAHLDAAATPTPPATLTAEAARDLTSAAQHYVVSDPVTARQLTEQTTWTNHNGSELTAAAGDWWLEDGRSYWTVKDEIFASTYRHVDGDLWKKTSPVRAIRLDSPTMVDTLEGPAEASPGDWLVIAVATGECWPVQGWIFEDRYVACEPDGSAPLAGEEP